MMVPFVGCGFEVDDGGGGLVDFGGGCMEMLAGTMDATEDGAGGKAEFAGDFCDGETFHGGHKEGYAEGVVEGGEKFFEVVAGGGLGVGIGSRGGYGCEDVVGVVAYLNGVGAGSTVADMTGVAASEDAEEPGAGAGDFFQSGDAVPGFGEGFLDEVFGVFAVSAEAKGEGGELVDVGVDEGFEPLFVGFMFWSKESHSLRLWPGGAGLFPVG